MKTGISTQIRRLDGLKGKTGLYEIINIVLLHSSVMVRVNLIVSEENFLQQNIFEAISQIYSNIERPNIKSIRNKGKKI